MGILDLLSTLLRRKKERQRASLEEFEAPEAPQYESKRIEETLQINKEALQLGVAAGYTGRALRHIEESLLRIESLMVTKDWFKTEFQDITPQLMQTLQLFRHLIEEHEKNEQTRFEYLQETLKRLEIIAPKAPEPIKKEIEKAVEEIKVGTKLSYQMEKIMKILEERKEISYEELAALLNYKYVSTVRGLISSMKKRTDKIVTFIKNKKGWIRFRALQ